MGNTITRESVLSKEINDIRNEEEDFILTEAEGIKRNDERTEEDIKILKYASEIKERRKHREHLRNIKYDSLIERINNNERRIKRLKNDGIPTNSKTFNSLRLELEELNKEKNNRDSKKDKETEQTSNRSEEGSATTEPAKPAPEPIAPTTTSGSASGRRFRPRKLTDDEKKKINERRERKNKIGTLKNFLDMLNATNDQKERLDNLRDGELNILYESYKKAIEQQDRPDSSVPLKEDLRIYIGITRNAKDLRGIIRGHRGGYNYNRYLELKNKYLNIKRNI